MPGRTTTLRFEANLAEIATMFIKTAIFLPDEVVGKIPKGRVRMNGTFNGAPFALAVQRLKDGSRFFSVSAALRKAACIRVGDKVKIVCKIVDPDKLDIPEELDAVLEQDEIAKKAWDDLTTGYKRSLIHYVTSVKNVDSRIKRSLDLLNKAKAGLLRVQRKGPGSR